MPTVSVDAGNDGPPSLRATVIGVSGVDFPPGSAVNIAAEGRRGTAQVGPDGAFDWNTLVRPKLACNAAVVAVVHGADGVRVTGETEVFCP